MGDFFGAPIPTQKITIPDREITFTDWVGAVYADNVFDGIRLMHRSKIGNLYLDRKERGRRRHQFMTHGKHGKKRPR
jgi:hypothetical protein